MSFRCASAYIRWSWDLHAGCVQYPTDVILHNCIPYEVPAFLQTLKPKPSPLIPPTPKPWTPKPLIKLHTLDWTLNPVSNPTTMLFAPVEPATQP